MVTQDEIREAVSALVATCDPDSLTNKNVMMQIETKLGAKVGAGLPPALCLPLSPVAKLA